MSKSNIKFNKQEVQQAFEKMLKRVGGGYKFVKWIDEEVSLKSIGERSSLAKKTSADFATSLYASDFKGRSHISAYAGAVFVNDRVRVYADIRIFEEEKEWTDELLGTSLGRVVSSFTETIDDEKYLQVEWRTWRLNRYLVILLSDLKKNIAEF
jgi:hypothetical protein